MPTHVSTRFRSFLYGTNTVAVSDCAASCMFVCCRFRCELLQAYQGICYSTTLTTMGAVAKFDAVVLLVPLDDI